VKAFIHRPGCCSNEITAIRFRKDGSTSFTYSSSQAASKDQRKFTKYSTNDINDSNQEDAKNRYTDDINDNIRKIFKRLATRI
jgi:hypothetical protein